MTFAVLLLVTIAVGLLSMVTLETLIRRPEVGTGLILALVVVSDMVDVNVISVSIGGFRVSPIDVGFATLAAAALLRLARVSRILTAQWAIVLLGITAVVSLLLGLIENDIGATVNEFRTYLAFVGASVYCSTIVIDDEYRAKASRAWFWAGIAIAGVILVRWAQRATGLNLGVFDQTYDAAIRVLDGPGTLFVATVGLMVLLPTIETAWAHRRAERYLGAILLIMAVLLNRRTLWAALAVGFVVFLAREREIRRRIPVSALVALAALGVILPIVFAEDGTEDPAAQSVTDVGTLVWRLEGWAALLRDGPDSPPDYILGEPFGTGFERTIRGSVKESNPHSFYVQTFLRTGLLGLGALMYALGLCLVTALRRRDHDTGPFARRYLLPMLVIQVVWFLAWPPQAAQGIVLGLTLAHAVSDSQWPGGPRALKHRGPAAHHPRTYAP